MPSASGAPSGHGSAPAAEYLPPASLLILQDVPDGAGSVSSCLVQNEEIMLKMGVILLKLSFFLFFFIVILYKLIHDTVCNDIYILYCDILFVRIMIYEIYQICFIPVTTRCGVVVQLEVDGVGGRGGDAASTGWEEESSFYGESASESIVDNESETQSLSN